MSGRIHARKTSFRALMRMQDLSWGVYMLYFCRGCASKLLVQGHVHAPLQQRMRQQIAAAGACARSQFCLKMVRQPPAGAWACTPDALWPRYHCCAYGGCPWGSSAARTPLTLVIVISPLPDNNKL